MNTLPIPLYNDSNNVNKLPYIKYVFSVFLKKKMKPCQLLRIYLNLRSLEIVYMCVFRGGSSGRGSEPFPWKKRKKKR